MDHLPYPSNVHEPIRVPYLRGPPYDNSGFEDYPERMGWKVETLQHGDDITSYPKSLSQVQSLLQSWIFFGMLSETLGIYEIGLNINDFICAKNNQLFEGS